MITKKDKHYDNDDVDFGVNEKNEESDSNTHIEAGKGNVILGVALQTLASTNHGGVGEPVITLWCEWNEWLAARTYTIDNIHTDRRQPNCPQSHLTRSNRVTVNFTSFAVNLKEVGVHCSVKLQVEVSSIRLSDTDRWSKCTWRVSLRNSKKFIRKGAME